jgi:hypothetical protein
MLEYLFAAWPTFEVLRVPQYYHEGYHKQVRTPNDNYYSLGQVLQRPVLQQDYAFHDEEEGFIHGSYKICDLPEPGLTLSWSEEQEGLIILTSARSLWSLNPLHPASLLFLGLAQPRDLGQFFDHPFAGRDPDWLQRIGR